MRSLPPNRYRIQGDRDADAQAIIDRAPDRIDQAFLATLDRDAASWLGRYGARQVTTALRQRSAVTGQQGRRKSRSRPLVASRRP